MIFSRLIHIMAVVAVATNVDENFFRPTDETFYRSLNANDFGVMGDGLSDNTLPIRYFLDKARTEQKDAFFPPGEYVISDNILVNGNATIHGSTQGITMLKAMPGKHLKIYIGNATPNAKLSNFSIANIFFNGVRMEFSGRFYKNNIVLSNCVFLTSQRSFFMVNPLVKYLQWERVRHGIVRNAIFLRSKASYGIGCGFFRTYGMKVHDNIFGLDMIDAASWLASQYRGIHTWHRLVEKLQFIKNYYTMERDQGQYRACIYGNHDDKMLIEGNIFNGSPRVENIRDHVIYLKGFDGLSVLGNYARGWPSDPSGGLKMRNGENLVVARNYLVDTAILLYTHNETCSYAYLHPGLSNVLVYGNHLVETRNVGAWGTGISYLEPHFVGKDTNIVFATNVFEIPRLNETYTPVGIHITNGDPREHHVFPDNVYFGTSTPVRLKGFREVRYERGLPKPDLVSPFMNILIPNIVIPVYGLGTTV